MTVAFSFLWGVSRQSSRRLRSRELCPARPLLVSTWGPGTAIQISWKSREVAREGGKALAGLSDKDGCDLLSDVVDRITAEQVSILTPPGGQVRLPGSLVCSLQVGRVSIFESGFGGYVSASATHILTHQINWQGGYPR